jgi:hypothetical protein
VLRLSAIAEDDEGLRATAWHGSVTFRRKSGEALDARRDSLQTLQQLRSSMGSLPLKLNINRTRGPKAVPSSKVTGCLVVVLLIPQAVQLQDPKLGYREQEWGA